METIIAAYHVAHYVKDENVHKAVHLYEMFFGQTNIL
jgi:hypothetical protein